MLAKIKNFVKTHKSDIILVVSVMLISLLSFATGFVTCKIYEKEPIKFENISEFKETL
jgi:uncharacterized membrane protein (DUF485 family)